jgi:hypothetical protein
MADYINRVNAPVAGGVTGKRALITSPSLLRWYAEGKIFEAGMGAESAPINSAASLTQVNPQLALQSPKNDTLVIPIQLRLAIVVEGGALTTWDLVFTKAAANCSTAMTFTVGTNLLHRSNANKAYNSTGEAVAIYGDKITMSANTVSDHVLYHYGSVVDNITSVSKLSLGEGGPTNVHKINFLNEGAPHIMTQGAAMILWMSTGTTDSTWWYYFQWAEVTADDLY